MQWHWHQPGCGEERLKWAYILVDLIRFCSLKTLHCASLLFTCWNKSAPQHSCLDALLDVRQFHVTGSLLLRMYMYIWSPCPVSNPLRNADAEQRGTRAVSAAYLFVPFFRDHSSALKVFSILGIILLTPCVTFLAASSSPKPATFPLDSLVALKICRTCLTELQSHQHTKRVGSDPEMRCQHDGQGACANSTWHMCMKNVDILHLSLTRSAGRFLLRAPSNLSVTPMPFDVGFPEAAAAEASQGCESAAAASASTISANLLHPQQLLSGPVSINKFWCSESDAALCCVPDEFRPLNCSSAIFDCRDLLAVAPESAITKLSAGVPARALCHDRHGVVLWMALSTRCVATIATKAKRPILTALQHCPEVPSATSVKAHLPLHKILAA